MFGIGETEFVIILVFAFLLFGPDKLPGIGRTVGRALRQFRDASNGFNEVVQTNIMDPAAEELKKSPKQRHAEQAAKAAGSADGSDSTQEQATASAPQHETFAERKARLQAERAKAAAEAPVVTEGYVDEDDADIDSDDDIAPAKPSAGASDSSNAAPTPKPEPQKPEEPKPTSAADLYAISERHSSRRAQQASAQSVTNTDAAPADNTSDGKEDGNAQA